MFSSQWVPRRILSDHGPKTIQQVRDDAARDFGTYLHSSVPARNMSISGGMLGMSKLRSGLDDVFSPIPIGNFHFLVKNNIYQFYYCIKFYKMLFGFVHINFYLVMLSL